MDGGDSSPPNWSFYIAKKEEKGISTVPVLCCLPVPLNPCSHGSVVAHPLTTVFQDCQSVVGGWGTLRGKRERKGELEDTGGDREKRGAKWSLFSSLLSGGCHLVPGRTLPRKPLSLWRGVWLETLC